jgi:hypothetical protein
MPLPTGAKTAVNTKVAAIADESTVTLRNFLVTPLTPQNSKGLDLCDTIRMDQPYCAMVKDYLTTQFSRSASCSGANLGIGFHIQQPANCGNKPAGR